MIQRLGRQYRVVSENTGRIFGTYDTLAEAKHRQIEIFKHLKARRGTGRRAQEG